MSTNITMTDSTVADTETKPPEDRDTTWTSEVRTLDVGLTVYTQLASEHAAVQMKNIGWVVDGLDAYLEEYKMFEMDIPETYKNWHEEFGGPTPAAEASSEVWGAIIRDNNYDPDSVLHISRCVYPARYVQSAHRILTGGGNYTADDYTLHVCAPLAILEGAENAVVLTPRSDGSLVPDEADVDYVKSENNC